MKRRIKFWILGILLAVVLAVTGSIGWLVATESGTRWLLAQASPLLPDKLVIGGAEGTVLHGLRITSMTWDDDTAQVSVASANTEFELLPLLKRNLNVTRLDIQGVSVVLGEPSEPVDDAAAFSLDLPIDLSLDAATISDVRIESGGEEYSLDSVELRGRLSGSRLNISRLDVRSELGEISLTAKAKLSDPYNASADATWKLNAAERPTLSGSLKLEGDAARYKIQHTLTSPYKIITRGWISLVQDDIRANLNSTWQSINLATSGGRDIDIRNGSLHVDGTLERFAFDTSATVITPEVPALTVSLRGSGNTQRVDLESATIVNDWGRLFANGTVIVEPEPAWELAYEIAEIDPGLVYPDLSGQLRIQGQSLGRIAGEDIITNTSIETLEGDLNGHPVSGYSDLSYADSVLRFRNTRIAAGDNEAILNGSYDTSLELNATLRLLDLNQLVSDAAGSLAGDLRLQSDLENFALTGVIDGTAVAWQNYSASRLQSRFDLPEGTAGNVAITLENLRMDDWLADTVNVDVAGSISAHTVSASFDAQQGHLDLRATGQLAAEQWSGFVTALKVTGGDLGEWSLQEKAALRVSASVIDVGRTCLVGTTRAGSACAELQYANPGPLQFSVSVSGLPVAALPFYLPESSRVTGTIEARAEGTLLDQRVTADATLGIENLGFSALHEGDEISIDFDQASVNARIVDNRLSSELMLRSADKSVQASADFALADVLDMQSAIQGSASVDLTDLELVSFLYPDVTKTAGRVRGNITVSNNLAAPDFIGEISLTDGAVEIQRAGISVTDIGLRLRQSEAGRLSLDGSAQSGEGRLALNGTTEMGSASGISTRLTITGENFSLIRLPEWQVATSPDISVLFDDRATRISGDLGIPTASIIIHEIPESAEQPSPDVVVHRQDETETTVRRELFIDVRTILGKAVSLSAFGLTTGLEGTVRITGGTQSPFAGSGRLVLKEGRYKAYGQNLQIERGELIFNGPLDNPTLDVRATRTASDNVVAGIHLTGTPLQLRSNVYSEPALGDAEALSYLLTGRALGSASTEQGNMLNQAAFALGLSTAGSVASRIRGDLGLDTLGVQGSSGQQQIVAGKRLGNRIFVEYAYGIVDSLGTLLLRYELNRRLVLESRSGSVTNVDLVYRVKKD